MDWLEREWYNKLRIIMSDDDALLLARVRAAMERGTDIIDKIKRSGFEGFRRWVEINCKDIYYRIKHRLQEFWNKVKIFFT